jgi:Tfp pilus assembly protein PilF
MTERLTRLIAMHGELPKDCFLNHALALEFIKLGDDTQARAYFMNNIAHDANYIATYYHLGKLQERAGETDAAIKTYEDGMARAKAQHDMHTYNELQAAYEDLVY